MSFTSAGVSKLTFTISSRRKLASSQLDYLVPGEIVPLSLQYSDFNPNEKTSMFISIQIVGGLEYNIFSDIFVTSSSGTGTYVTNWAVPWDKLLASNATKQMIFKARTSHQMMDAVASSDPFTTVMFTETDGIFTKPALNEVIPIDFPYYVTWDPKLLKFFDSVPGTLYSGEEAVSKTVNLAVVRDVFALNGTILGSTQYSLAKEIPNSGKANVLFSSNANYTVVDARCVSKYYLVVLSTEFANIQSWSSGYFEFSSSPTPNINRQLGGVFKKPAARALTFDSSSTKQGNIRVRDEIQQARTPSSSRKLQSGSCAAFRLAQASRK
jgi:hypothetical protein